MFLESGTGFLDASSPLCYQNKKINRICVYVAKTQLYLLVVYWLSVLCYKSEGGWFDPSWCQWIFHRHKILLIALWLWGDSASNRNEYQQHFLGVKAVGA